LDLGGFENFQGERIFGKRYKNLQTEEICGKRYKANCSATLKKL
jgi:hypothetical protein